MIDIIKKNLKILLISNIVIIIIGLITCFVLPQKYTAYSTFVKKTSTDNPLLAINMGFLFPIQKTDVDVYNILTTRWIMDKVNKRENLKEYYKAKIPEQVYASYIENMKLDDKKDGMYILYYTDKDPKKAASICNTIMEALEEFYVYKDSIEANQYITFLKQAMNDLNDEIETINDSIASIYEKAGINYIPNNTSILTALQNPTEMLRDSIVEKYILYKYYSYKNPNSIMTKQYKKELDLLYKEWESIYTQGIKTPNNIPIIGSNKKLPSLITDLMYLNAQLEIKLFTYGLLSKEYYSNIFKEKKKNTDIQVIDYAVAPNKRSFPKRKLIMIGFIFIAIILDVLFIHYKAGQIKTV